MNADDLTAKWMALGTSTPRQGLFQMAPLGVRVRDGEVRLGRDHAGLYYLFVPIPVDAKVLPDRDSKNIMIEPMMVAGERHLVLSCAEASLADLFALLVGELVEELEARPDEALSLPFAALAKWRELLARGRSTLSDDARAGLFAELWILCKILDLDPAKRADVWKGPLGGVHDMSRQGSAIEVKGSLMRTGRRALVHGITQLEAPTEGRLHLCFVRIERDDQGTNLTDLMRRSGIELKLRPLAERVGFDPSDDAARFKVTEESWYLVDGSFPRLINEDLANGHVPPGVLGLQYEIDLSGPVPVSLSRAAVENLIQEMARS